MPHHFLKFETILQFKCPSINKATVDNVFVEFHVFKNIWNIFIELYTRMYMYVAV